MAKLERKNFKVFAENAPLEEMGQFGSAVATTKKNTKDIEEIQELEAWQQGWGGAVISNKNYPPMEEMNGALNVMSYQTAYTLQEGIPEWNKDTVYYIGSIVKTLVDNKVVLYQSLKNDNIGNVLDNSEYWEKLSLGGSGLEICDIGMALYVDETKGLRRYLNGQIVNINANTKAFLNRLKQITTLHPSLLCTEEEWQTAKTISAFGQVGKFVFNYSGDEIVSVRLPRVVNVQGLFDLQNLGMTVSAGLPNITGHIEGRGLVDREGMLNASGCLLPAQSVNRQCTQSNPDGVTTQAFNIDASLSNSIYGKSNTVQPEAIQYPYFIQIATGSETENNIINEIELNNPFSLFDSKYSEYELNNLSWLKSEGQWNSKAAYPSAYDELLREYNSPDRLATFNRGAFTVVGSPTITDEGIASGFSSQPSNPSYITLPTFQLGQSNSWKIHMSFNTSDSLRVPVEWIFVMSHGGYSGGISIGIESGLNLRIRLASTDSSTGDLVDKSFVKIIKPNTKYEVIVEFTGTTYNISYKIDNNGWVVYTIQSTTKLYNDLTSSRLGYRGNSSVEEGFSGSIDLKRFSITIDGQKVFSGANSMVKLSTEEYTDYDFRLNTADETFMLPLKTLHSDDAVDSLSLYFYVGETVQNANLIDAGRIGEQVANKQDKCIHIIDTYVNGTSGYRVWSDGYCEQWGITPTGSNSYQTINLLKAYKDTNYSILMSGRTNTGNTASGELNQSCSLPLSTTQFAYYRIAWPSHWKAYGYTV